MGSVELFGAYDPPVSLIELIATTWLPHADFGADRGYDYFGTWHFITRKARLDFGKVGTGDEDDWEMLLVGPLAEFPGISDCLRAVRAFDEGVVDIGDESCI